MSVAKLFSKKPATTILPSFYQYIGIFSAFSQPGGNGG